MTHEPLRRQPTFTPHPPQGQALYGQAPPHQSQVQYRGLPSAPQRQASSNQSSASPRRQRRRQRRRLRVVLWAFVGVAAAIITIVIITLTSTSASSGGATYSAHAVSYKAVNPYDLSVVAQVTNTGPTPGTPACTVKAQDSSDTYTGVGFATLPNSVAPNASAMFVTNLTITKQRAKDVTQVTVSC